ncbi:ABC transporter permease [Tropicimonas isoalkanivorans]|uniref:Spermidine/putrescine transport system permease protein n=1 Tax=Tropicimonas isoalkanivorans TaxID=441112 RepID=A0A1I1HD82_9RHOB|nr:ABC transporter permease [Tropicimonas isoalkanivorans]SFC21967.1 spermidine/putrescine transport system permease protein [Tropicimonas isoalkanivorans]
MPKRLPVYPYVWRLPLLIWQGLFFVGPLILMVAMSFWLVRNYRMEPAFVFDNWERMLGRDYFWNAYFITVWRASVAAVLASLIAFPASFTLAFRVSESARRWAIFFLIVPFFTSYLVRIYAWQVLLAESGPINAVLGMVGLGPFTMLNSGFGATVGYLTLVLPLVVILQTFSLASVDRNLIEAAWNLGANRRATLFRVIIPAAKVGLILGLVFAFILSFGDFVSPFYLGGSKPPTLSILIIDTTKSGQQWPRAAVVAVMMIVTLFVVAFAAVGAAYGRRK